MSKRRQRERFTRSMHSPAARAILCGATGPCVLNLDGQPVLARCASIAPVIRSMRGGQSGRGVKVIGIVKPFDIGAYATKPFTGSVEWSDSSTATPIMDMQAVQQKFLNAPDRRRDFVDFVDYGPDDRTEAQKASHI